MTTRLIKHVTMLIVLGAMVSSTLFPVEKGRLRRMRAPKLSGNVNAASVKSDLPCFLVKSGKFSITMASGLVEPVRAETLRCPLEGTSVILSILPERTLVKKGQLVCELESSSFRDRRAGPGDSRTREEVTASSRRPIERIKLYAPADGTLQWGGDPPFYVDRPPLKPGAHVFKKWCVFGLYDPTGPMRVRTAIHEAVIDQVRTGMPARVRLDAFPRERFTGTVLEIAPLPNRISSFNSEPKYYDTLVSIDHGSPRIQPLPRPGMKAQVEILANDLDNVLSVPLEACAPFRWQGLRGRETT